MNPSSGWTKPNIRIRASHITNTKLVRPRPDLEDDFEIFPSADGFCAYVRPAVLDFIAEHAKRNGEKETIGLLCGRICIDPDEGPYTLVMAAGDARHGEFQSTSGDVKLLPSGHNKLRYRLVNAHPDREIVGWYHTHPNYPPRFSNVDFDEQATWTDPNHLGIVYSGLSVDEPFGVYRGPGATLLRPAGLKAPKPELRNAPQSIAAGASTTLDPTISNQSLSEQLIPPRRARESAGPLPMSKPALPSWRRFLRIEIAILTICAILCITQAFGFFWLWRRISSAEAALLALSSSRTRPDGAEERSRAPISSTPGSLTSMSSPSPATSSAEPGEKAKRIIDPEFLPSKPMAPGTVPSRTDHTQKAARSRTSAGERNRDGKKRPEKDPGKPGAPRKFSSPGEQILSNTAPKASPQPSPKPK